MNKEQFMKFLDVLTKEQAVTKALILSKEAPPVNRQSLEHQYNEGVVDGRLELMGTILNTINTICYGEAAIIGMKPSDLKKPKVSSEEMA